MENWDKILNAVKKPISLVVLAVLVVNAIFLIVVKEYSLDSLTRELFPILTLIFLLIVVVLSMSKIQNSKHDKEDFDRKIEDIISDLKTSNGTNDIIEKIKDIISTIKQSFNYDNYIFRSAVLKKLIDFRGEIKGWKNGILYVGPNDSRGFLIKIYENAQKNVFSTSAKDFSEHWTGNFGNKVLKANEENHLASTLRIFIFNQREDVQEQDYSIIKKTAKKINVRVYFDKDDDVIRFKPGFSKDFTLIDDGKIIGVTESFGINNNLTSRWHFNDTDEAEELNIIKNSLLLHSHSLVEFERIWETLSNKK